MSIRDEIRREVNQVMDDIVTVDPEAFFQKSPWEVMEIVVNGADEEGPLGMVPFEEVCLT